MTYEYVNFNLCAYREDMVRFMLPESITFTGQDDPLLLMILARMAQTPLLGNPAMG
jgi:hypothetical protein